MLKCERVLRDCNCLSSCSPPFPEPDPSLAHRAAEDVFRKPISPSVESLRRQQRILLHSKRTSRVRLPSGRISGRRTTTIVPVRRPDRSPGGSVAAAEREVARIRRSIVSDALRPLTPSPRRHNRESIQQTHPLYYIEMEMPIHAVPSPPKRESSMARRPVNMAEPYRPRKPRISHTRPIAGPSGSPSRHRPSRTRAGRPVPVGSSLKQREITLSAVQETTSESHRQPVASNAKRFGVADPQLRNAIRRSLSQQSQVSLLASPSRRSSIQSSGPRQPPSRTSSNRRAVDRFTKQLEIYAQRREAAGKLPVNTPTPESVVSLHTVNALLPYQDQFLAAGLAVTSDQQRPKREPSASPAKDKGIETIPVEQERRPAETRSKESQSRDNPGHLQFNGQRSPSWDSSYDSSLGTQVAFTQPEAWELAYIDEVPEKKPGCCNLTCFTGRQESSEIPANRVPPAQTPTTVDTPNKILDKWHPVYPQKDEVIWIKSPKGTDFRDPRVKTWHGDTAQRPSTYRPARKPQPEDDLEATSPTTKRPGNQAPAQENVPPIPPRAPGRIKTSVSYQESTADSATAKGVRKPGQRDVFLDTTDAILVKTKASTQEPSSTRRPMKPIVESVSDENTHLTEEVPVKTPKETTKAQTSTQEPTRISVSQPERKAKEKAARQNQQVQVEHPGIFHSGRMFQSLQEPPKLTEQQPQERSAATSLGTLSPKLDLPSTWKLTLSNPSSLEEAIEQASREMEERNTEDTQTAGNNQPVLTEKKQPEAIDLTKAVKELFSHPADKENAPTTTKLPKKNTESSISTHSSLSTEHDDRAIDDRDVLRGLNIAISAACDEEVDAWIRQKTGVRIRRFLADLRAFETLAEEDEADPKHERSRIRRTESRKLQAQIRQSKAAREARAQ